MAEIVYVRHRPKLRTYLRSGPASYATGGFAFDFSADFAYLTFVAPALVDPGPNLNAHEAEIPNLNRNLSGQAFGQCVMLLRRDRYDRATIGSMSGVPAGVDTDTSVGVSDSATATHSHPINHDHPAAGSGAPTAAGGGVAAQVGGINLTLHNHDTFDVPAFTGSSDSPSHSHQRDFEYEHDHPVTAPTQTDMVALEVVAGTVLSGASWRLAVFGF